MTYVVFIIMLYYYTIDWFSLCIETYSLIFPKKGNKNWIEKNPHAISLQVEKSFFFKNWPFCKFSPAYDDPWVVKSYISQLIFLSSYIFLKPKNSNKRLSSFFFFRKEVKYRTTNDNGRRQMTIIGFLSNSGKISENTLFYW